MSGLVEMSRGLLEKGWIPDPLIRQGIRRLLQQKLDEEKAKNIEFGQAEFIQLLHKLQSGPIAIAVDDANQQHYEVPTTFFKKVLGKHMKYSSAYYRDGVTSLDQAEEDMLAISVERADIEDGQTILELGCGWGSMSLYLAKRFPHSKIVGVSNSRTQKEYIDGEAALRNLSNLEIITADMNHFHTHQKFDRIVSVEMFEHMHNHEKLLEKVAFFLNKDGKLFVHIFTHREYTYLYDHTDPNDWIAKYFFTGGIMPSDHYLLYFPHHFVVENHWRVSGVHYQKTSEAWLKNMDEHKDEILPILEKTYGKSNVLKWWNYWRVFFLSCAELWGYKNGTEWLVSHYLLRKRA